MFFSSDEPEDIIWLVEHYPEFKPLYEDGYELCRNMERVMTMWSKELQQLDKNTVQYMIDEMQDTIDEQKSTIKTQQGKIETQQGKIETQQDTILAQQKALDEKDKLIQKLKAAVEKKEQ